KKRQKYTGGREQCRREHGDRRGEAAELEEKNDEDQHDRQQQNKDKFVKRLLLLSISATIFNTNTGRKMQSRDRVLYGGNSPAQIESFEPCCDGDVALQIIPLNLCLPGQIHH